MRTTHQQLEGDGTQLPQRVAAAQLRGLRDQAQQTGPQALQHQAMVADQPEAVPQRRHARRPARLGLQEPQRPALLRQCGEAELIRVSAQRLYPATDHRLVHVRACRT